MAGITEEQNARYRVWLNGREVVDRYWSYSGFADTTLVPQFVRLPRPWLTAPASLS